MQALPEKTRRRPFGFVFSLVLHGGALLVVAGAGLVLKTRFPESPRLPMAVPEREHAGGSHAVKLELPPMPDAGRRPKHAAEEPRAKAMLPAPQPPKRRAGGSVASPHHGEGKGPVDQGNGDDAREATPAFPTFSPRPQVIDRSLLPRAEQKIVVDVDVDEVGAVVREVLVKGMGNSLDKLVLDTVKSWHFQPATVNGKPVATQAEVIIPFGPDTPVGVS